MNDQAPRIEPQYLQAATQHASQLITLVWQKMALIFAVQSASIVAAYFLRGSLSSWITLLLGAAFCSGIAISIHFDLKGRTALLSQANHIARQLLRCPSEDIVMSLEPYPAWSLRSHWTFWRFAILIVLDALVGVIFNVQSINDWANVCFSIPLLPAR